ncbi:MAG: hypothetical protein ACPGN3_10130 [Opitutales bacterium]
MKRRFIHNFTRSLSILLFVCSLHNARANVSVLSYFDMGAKAYYSDDLEAAKEAVNLGLDQYPSNEELTALRDLIEKAQQRQQQQQQEQEEQEESEEQEDQDGDSGDQGDQGQQGDQGDQGQQGQDGQNSQEGQDGDSSDQSGDSSQQSNSENGQDGQDSGDLDGDRQGEKSAEEYADQTLDGQDDGQFGEADPDAEGNPAEATDAGGEGRTVYMTEEEAMRLLETLSGQEKQLPFITIDRADADKLSRDKRDY